jgi:hypothetical protein
MLTDLAIRNIPIKCLVILESFLHQAIVKKVANMVVVRFGIEREGVAVFEKRMELLRKFIAHLMHSGLFAFQDVTSFQALSQ